MVTPEGQEVLCRTVEVDFDPFAHSPASVRKNLGYSGEMLHCVGNVGELVKLDESTGGRPEYGVAGGDWNSNYQEINLQMTDDKNPREYSGRSARIGFRILIDVDLDRADPEFLEEAEQVESF
jgi:hypothetical protein